MSTYADINSIGIASLSYLRTGSGNNEYVYTSLLGVEYTFYNNTGQPMAVGDRIILPQDGPNYLMQKSVFENTYGPIVDPETDIGVDIDANSTSTALDNGDTWTGEWVQVSAYGSVVCAVKTDKSGTLYMEFSPDGVNADSSLSFSVTANVNEVHRLSVTRKYFRARFTNNSGSNQTFFRLQCLAGSQPILTSALNSTVQTDADAVLTRGILMGQTDSGSFVNVPATPEGHLEVAIHEPRLPFGSVHVENLTPVFQYDAVYGVNSDAMITSTVGTGTATTNDSLFVCTTGGTIGGRGTIASKKRLRYRSGQGFVARFTAMFTTGEANSFQVAGFGNPEDGLFFGYYGADFGIYYSRRGVQETRTLTLSVGATVSSNVTITLDGTAFTVPVTNASSVYRTAYEIASYSYTGWNAQAYGATVIFIKQVAGTANGTYSFGAGTTGASASFAQTKAGVAITTTFIKQSDWNGDKMDGNVASGVLLDPTKLNVYQIGMQYLGAGAITFQIESAPSGNNATWVTVHTLSLPNTLTTSSFGNPSFPFTMSATKANNTATDFSVKSASVGGFIEGQKVLSGSRYSYYNSLSSVSTSLKPLMTVMNRRYYKGRVNQSVINLLSISGAIKHTSPVIYYLIKNGTLTGNPNFTEYATDSCSAYDTAATGITYTNEKLIWTGHVGDTGEIDHHFGNGGYNAEEVTIQPGEYVTLAVASTTGTANPVTGSINTREDQ